ncbi:ABC transporter substrate-binding protein [Streptomyces sp. SCSIO ZS0520]|uniref:ABC transporter substrate-binding protein n=1 Tax=Streptomyces sp. SCSIO ZS0520 TaxID=2892996 RepID=UPI0021D9ECD1|nr:ABC transporter substrate-binding protein [Streptomyces sp. SCSIO ZS0520]
MVDLNRRHLLTALGGGAAALAVGGCRSAADSGQSSGASGEVLRLAQIADIQPQGLFSQNANDFTVARLLFNSLTRYDHRTLEPRPELAREWRWSADRRRLTLRLREGVSFHSGREFTAADVIASIRAQQDPKNTSQLINTAAAVTGLRARGDHELELRLSRPVNNLFDLFELMPVVDRKTLPGLLGGKQIIGTGPFRLKSWAAGDEAVLVRNPRYWRRGTPRLAGVRIRTIPQLQSLVASLRTGQSDFVPGLAPADVAGLSGDKRFTTRFTDTRDNGWYLGVNVRKEAVKDRRTRQALSYAVDRERMAEVVFKGTAEPTSLPWPASSPAHRPELTGHYTHRPAKARKLLDEAGGAPRGPLRLAYNSSLPATRYLAQIVQSDLAEVGVEVRLMPLLGADLGARLGSGELPELWINTHGFAHLHPASLVTGAKPFRYDANASGYTGKEYAKAAETAWTATGAAAREAYDTLNSVLLREQFVISLVQTGAAMTMTRRLKGLDWSMFDALDLDEATLDAA